MRVQYEREEYLCWPYSVSTYSPQAWDRVIEKPSGSQRGFKYVNDRDKQLTHSSIEELRVMLVVTMRCFESLEDKHSAQFQPKFQ